MTGDGQLFANGAGEAFADMLQTLVAHRGLAAEQELIEVLGFARLMQIYDGAEPVFGEFLEIARVLKVPLSAFQIADPGDFPDLETAFAELLYSAAAMTAGQRAALARKLRALARAPHAPGDGPGAGAPGRRPSGKPRGRYDA